MNGTLRAVGARRRADPKGCIDLFLARGARCSEARSAAQGCGVARGARTPPRHPAKTGQYLQYATHGGARNPAPAQGPVRGGRSRAS